MAQTRLDALFDSFKDLFPEDPGVLISQKGIVHRSNLPSPCPRVDLSATVEKVEIDRILRSPSVTICPQCLMSLL